MPLQVAVAQASWDASQGGVDTYNYRIMIDAAQVLLSGGNVKVEFVASTVTSDGFSISSAYIGHQATSGNDYDFDGGQVQLLFGGSAAKLIANGTSEFSDATAFTLDDTKNLIISFGVAADLSNGRFERQDAGATGFSHRYQINGYTKAGDTIPSGIYQYQPYRSAVGQILVEVLTTYAATARGTAQTLKEWSTAARGQARTIYEGRTATARGTARTLNSHTQTARGYARTIYTQREQTARGTYRLAFETREQTARGGHRLANDFDTFNLYHATDGAAFDYSTPIDTNDTGVFTLTPAVDTLHRYTVRRKNPYGLESQNVDYVEIDVDASGDQLATPPSAAQDVLALATIGGVVQVSATYFPVPDGDNAATEFLIYYTTDGTDPDPTLLTPATVAATAPGGIAFLEWSSAAQATGVVVKAIVSTRKGSAESTRSAIVTATADATAPTTPDGVALILQTGAIYDA